MKRTNISSWSPMEKPIGFSRAVKIWNIIAVSWTAPIWPDWNTAHPNDVYNQTKYCIEIMKKAVEEAWWTLEDVIRTRIYLTDISKWEESAKAHWEIFSDIRPATTFVEVKGLIKDSWLVETECDCVLD